MKCVSSFLLIILLIAGCSKEFTNDTALTGTWVEKQNRLDTLQVYRSGNKLIMFDKTEYDRMVARGMQPGDKHFRHQVKLKEETIGFRPFDARTTDPYAYYSFKWIEFKKEFRMSYNGLRPYLSSIGSNNWVKLN